MSQKISTKQAVTNAIAIKKELISEIQTSGKFLGRTDRVISQVSDHPVEVAHLANYCHQLDEKYGSDTALELRIELEIRYEQ